MGAGKVLIGVVFLALGLFLLVIGLAPIDIIGDVSVTNKVMVLIDDVMSMMSTMDFSALFAGEGTMLYIAVIIPWVGYHFCKAGIKSMRYEKKKKQYYYSETKIGFLVAGFIIMCVAFVLVLTMLMQILEPAFTFLADFLAPYLGVLSGFAYLIPQLLVPILLTLLIIYFTYWIGSKIMKHGVKKEKMDVYET